MKKIYLIIAVLLSASVSYAGFGLGLTGAVKNKVKEIDQKKTEYNAAQITATTRPFYMGFSVLMPYAMTNEAVTYMYDSVRAVSDLDYWHFDSGMPWPDTYTSSISITPRFQSEIDFKVSKRNAGSKLYLAVNAISSNRDGVALYEAQAGSNSALPAVWTGRDFDDPLVLQVYLNYARYMINKFNPDYFNFAIEVNSMAQPTKNPASFAKFVPFSAQVYSTLKSEFPKVKIFMSFSNNEDTWTDIEEVKKLVPNSDLIGLSFYPYRDPALISENLINQVANLDRSKKIAFCEFGYTAQDFTIFSTPITGSDTWQRAFLERYMAVAQSMDCEFMCWFLHRDYDAVIQYFIDNSYPAGIIESAKAWEYSGLVDHDGRERPALEVWKSWLRRPVYKK